MIWSLWTLYLHLYVPWLQIDFLLSDLCQTFWMSILLLLLLKQYNAMITLFPGCVYIDAGQFKLILYLLATSIAIAETKSQKVPENGKKYALWSVTSVHSCKN